MWFVVDADDDFYELLAQKLNDEKKTTSENDFFPELDNSDNQEYEKDPETENENKRHLIGLASNIHDVNGVSVTLIVSVESIERVWCQAVPEGTSVDPEQLQDQFLGETVSEKESIVCSRVFM